MQKQNNIIVEIIAGSGGDDSKLFIKDMCGMYVRYCDNNNLICELIHQSESSITLKISGNNAHELFKQEIGNHCVQRVPPTETKGRRHTSIISIGVMKLEHSYFKINEKDLEIISQRGHGSGGQAQNKISSAVRIKHLPTNISVFINGRSQYQNKQDALEIITSRVEDYYKKIEQLKLDKNRIENSGNGNRGMKIRTYNFIDSRVVNHITGNKTSMIKEVMKGKLELII